MDKTRPNSSNGNKGLNRRQFLVGLAAAGTAAVAAPVSASASSRLASHERSPSSLRSLNKPNILMVLVDQHTADAVSCYGFHDISTPNIDALAAKGARLESMFANSALCTPARASLVSGYYPHLAGASINHDKIGKPRSFQGTFGKHLRKAGYSTAWLGKWHLAGEAKPAIGVKMSGFKERDYAWNRGHFKKAYLDSQGELQLSKKVGKDDEYPSVFLTDRSLELMDEMNGPWIQVLSFPDPHSPHKVSEPYANQFSANDVWLPPGWDATGSDLPPWTRDHKNYLGDDVGAREAWLRKNKTQYLGMVACIDEQIGRLTEGLEDRGQLDNTIIIYMSDHGELMGEYGSWAKTQMVPSAHRVPFIVSWGDKIQPRVVKEVCSFVDFKSTLLELVKGSGGGISQGDSFAPLLFGDSAAWTGDSVAYLHSYSPDEFGIVTDQWFMGLHRHKGNVLYDRLRDPRGVQNVYDDNSGAVSDLTGRLKDHLAKTKPPEWSWV